jgi:hypothetical protein
MDAMFSSSTKLSEAIAYAGGEKPVAGEYGIVLTIRGAPKAVAIGGRGLAEGEVLLPKGKYTATKVTRLNSQQAHIELTWIP